MSAGFAASVEQVDLNRVKQMPDFPQPYVMRDWKAVALAQDKLLFDETQTGPWLPLYWQDDTRNNFPDRQGTFGLPSYIGHKRQQVEKGATHEIIAPVGAVYSASLLGKDKSNENGRDYVSGFCQYYDHTSKVIRNAPVRFSPYMGSMWYGQFPGVAFSMICDLYPEQKFLDELNRKCAEQWLTVLNAVSDKDGKPDFHFHGFDFAAMKPVNKANRTEDEIAGSTAYILYNAYVRYGDKDFLDGALRCLDYIEAADPGYGLFYELCFPYGVLAAARANAEQGKSYNIEKFLNFCFDARFGCRQNWGVSVAKAGGMDFCGLTGQQEGENSFNCPANTWLQIGALMPVCRYDKRFTRTLAKYVLNAANSSRFFYSKYLDVDQQTSLWWKGDPDSVVAYECVVQEIRKLFDGAKKISFDGKSNAGILAAMKRRGDRNGPFAVGDPFRAGWADTDYALYQSVWVGILGAIIEKTEVEGILRLNVTATDHFAKHYPTYVYYNPHQSKATLTYPLPPQTGLYDVLGSRKIEAIDGKVELRINPGEALQVVEIPVDAKFEVKGTKLLADGIIVDYQYATP